MPAIRTKPDPTRSTALDWARVARHVLRSRALDDLEERELAPSGEVPYQFSARGHELAQVLLALQLTHPHDAATVYYRSRPFMLTTGLTPAEALAAGMGRSGSPSEGRDVGVVFSMARRPSTARVAEPRLGDDAPLRMGQTGPLVLPASGDVGAQYTPAAGYAQAIRYRARVLGERDWEGAIAVALAGEGSVATNGFWAALTMATTLGLPMLFFIEDNGYGISVPGSLQTPGGDIAANLQSFGGLLALRGPGSEPEPAAALIEATVAHVRRGDGPALLRLSVPRLSGHTFIDNQAYRTEAERRADAERDPALALAALIGEPAMASLREEAEAEAIRALEEARARPAPPADQVRRFVFFEGTMQQVGGMSPEVGSSREVSAAADPRILDQGPRVNLIDAVRSVLEQELETNPRALVFGEDVGAKGGVHGATTGLQNRFGPERVFDTSLSEEGIIGRSVGMALAGLLPIPEIQFRKYADPATEQINDLGTLRWRTAGKFAAPVVVRIPVGFGKKIGDPWHSVSGESVYAHTLGWRLAYPSNAADAAGLLRAALRGEDPTFFFEHRALLDTAPARRPDPGPDHILPFGRAARLLAGEEATLITWGAMVYPALDAAGRFPGRVEVMDLRTIVPWDREAVMESVRRTGRCLVVHEDTWTTGFASEILASVVETLFTHLDAPARRLTTPDVPIPYSADLMKAVLPNSETIAAACAELLAF